MFLYQSYDAVATRTVAYCEAEIFRTYFYYFCFRAFFDSKPNSVENLHTYVKNSEKN